METNKKSALFKLLARVIITSGDDVLIVRRSRHDSRPGSWEIPGGSVDAGENIEQAAQREIREETGIDIAELEYRSSTAYDTKSDHRIAVVFEAKANSRDVKLSEEHDQYQWCSKSNFYNFVDDANNVALLNDYFGTDKELKGVAKKATKGLIVDAYSDGGSRGNPGPSASGFVIYDQHKTILSEGGEYLGITTNNQAEYQAVRAALKECIKLGADEISFYVDSMLVVNQMSGAFKVSNRELWPIHESIKSLVAEFKRVDFIHIPREQNKFADAKVNEVLDSLR